jgi:diguanylate cyclase (GGDEF)-like protein
VLLFATVVGLEFTSFAAGMIVSAVILVLSAAGVVAGIRLHRPARPAAWWLLAVSQVAFLAGASYFLYDDHFPGPSDALYLIVQYPAMITAMWIFVRSRTPKWHRASLIDAAVLATSAALASWVYVLRPTIEALGGGPVEELLVGVSYPVVDLLMLAIAMRLSLGGGGRNLSHTLLMSCYATWLASDLLYLLERLAGDFTTASTTAFGYTLAVILLGAAALHPSMTALDEPVDTPPEPTRARLGLLAAAVLIAPVILVVEYLRGTLEDVLVIAAACALLFLLVFVRMADLVSSQRQQAITDPLTGLYTRRFFGPALTVEVTRAGRTRVPLGLLLLDVDHFKQINDVHGHPAGDTVLQVVATRLTALCRSGDIVARYGGEEFAVLMPGAGPDRLAELAELVRRSMSEPMVAGTDGPVGVTVSIGTATVPADAQSPEEVVRLADAALYEAKRGGRNRVVAASGSRDAVPV